MTSPGEPRRAPEGKAERLRRLIGSEDILVLPGIFDGYSARLVQKSGYAAAFITGGGLSEARLGWADMGIMGLEDNLTACRQLVGATDLPLIADGDTGYGNAVNVHFTVKSFERAGVCGLMIEDQVWPKRCGHMAGKQVISAEEAAEKVRAAVEARVDPNFVIKSRTDAYATDGLGEVIRRLNLYGAAGADLLFADALLKVNDIATVVRNVSKPVCVNMGFGIRQRSTTPLLSARQLQDLGVAVVIYPRLLTAAALQGMDKALAALKNSLDSGAVVDRPDLLYSFEQINELTGLPALQQLERRHAVGGEH